MTRRSLLLRSWDTDTAFARTSAKMGDVEERFRSSFGQVLTVVVAAVAAASVAVLLVVSGWRDALLTLPWTALVVLACWAFFWRPHVAVSDAGVRLVNVTRTVFLPWPAIREIDTRFALALTTDLGRFSAWAAPAAGAGTALRSQMRLRRRGAATRSVSKGDLEGTPSGDAAAIVRRRWERLRDAGYLDDPRLEHRRAPVTWHWELLAPAAVLLAACLATLAIG